MKTGKLSEAMDEAYVRRNRSAKSNWMSLQRICDRRIESANKGARRPSNRRNPMISSLLIAAVLTSAPAAAIDLRTLNARLAQTTARMQAVEKRLQQTCTDRAEQLDGDGRAQHVFVVTARQGWDSGYPTKVVLDAREDGRDVTSREQTRVTAELQNTSDSVRERGNYGGIDFSNPFSADAQRKYRYWVVEPKPGDGSLVRIHFEPNGEATPRLNTGEALVDPASATLVSIDAHPSDYPSFVRFVHFEAKYANTSEGPVRTDFRVEGAGGFLFVKKHYREATHCSDFARGEGPLSTR
jgi:hypothetical protein